MDRLLEELEFHNRQAAARALDLADERLRFADDEWLDHETWIRPAFDRLGDVNGKTVLDYGCGHGMASVVLARRGAITTGFDLSPEYVREAERRAVINGVEVKFWVADGEHLPFADGSFDAVWGNAILHHLDMDRAGAELARVLKPGGIAVFCEPWGGNPFLEFARRRLPYPQKARTQDESPLRFKDVQRLRRSFPNSTMEGRQLLGMIRRVWKNRPVLRALDAADDRLMQAIPGLSRWCRYVVLTLRNSGHDPCISQSDRNLDL